MLEEYYTNSHDQILYYKYRNKLYLSVQKTKTKMVDIYQLNRDTDTNTLIRKYLRRLSNEEFINFIHRNGIMLWSRESLKGSENHLI